ncbi:MAG: FAD-binding protein, partial [Deltaproteobacteria bacterium]|nr:FAD-binding protein [Deltaproteobacteria bacterium]
MPYYSTITTDILQKIEEATGFDCIVRKEEKLAEYGKDAGEISHAPEIVIEATSSVQIERLLCLANLHRFPVTPRGLGTGLAGGSVPIHGGVLLSLARMNRIISIEEDNMIAIVEPGVLTLDLKEAVRKKGLFYPPDPASLDTSSVGGNAATNAGGPSCVKYGTTRDYILGIEAVLPSGKTIKTGVATRKGVVGYDLLGLIVGSEGTLGVITKLTLKLIPHPPAITTIVAFFPELPAAMKAVTTILMKGHIPCALEFMDRKCITLVRDLLPFEGMDSTGAFLLIETDGAPDIIKSDIEMIGHICMEGGAINVIMAPDSVKRARMWEVRREVSLRIENNFPLYIPEDVVLPLGKIADFVACLPEYEKSYGMNIFSFGHAGDGNIHLNVTAEDHRSKEKVEEGIESLLKRVINMGGTISGEHGIGIAKRRYLPLELSA